MADGTQTGSQAQTAQGLTLLAKIQQAIAALGPLGGPINVNYRTIASAGDSPATPTDAVLFLGSAGGSYDFVVPRSIGGNGKTQLLAVIRTGGDSNAVTFKDDLGAVIMTIAGPASAVALIGSNGTTVIGATA